MLLISVFVLWIVLDLCHIYKYKFCKHDFKKNSSCKNWMCKRAKECIYSFYYKDSEV